MGYASVGSGLQNSIQAVWNPSIPYYKTADGATISIYSQEVDVTNKSYLAYSLNHEVTGMGNGVFNLKFGTTVLATNTENGSDSDLSNLIDITAYSGTQTVIVQCVNDANTRTFIRDFALWMVD